MAAESNSKANGTTSRRTGTPRRKRVAPPAAPGGPVPPVRTPRPPVLPPTTALGPKDVLAILRRRLWLILGLTLLGFLAGGGTWFLLRRYCPRYTAESYLEVLPPVQRDPTVITSPQVNKDIQYGYRVSIANLIMQQGMLQDLLKRNEVRETGWFGRQADTTEALKYLMKYLRARAHRDADFVGISLSCRSAREAALIVNAMAELFVQSQGGQERDTISEKLAQLEQRRTQIQTEIEQQNAAQDKLRAQYGIDDVGFESGSYRYQHPVVAQFAKLQQEEDDLQVAIKQLMAHIENVKALATGPITEQIAQAIERDPVMITLAQQLAAEQSNLASKKGRFGPEHRVRRQIQERIDELTRSREQRRQEIAEQTRRADLQAAQQQLIVMQQRLEEVQRLRREAEAKKKDLDLARIEFERTQTVRDERIAALNQVKEQIEKWRISYDDPETAKVRIKARALAPIEMDPSRHWLVWFPAGTILGLLAGVALAFLGEMLNDRLRGPADVAQCLPIPLLGVIPDELEDDLPRDANLDQVVRLQPTSILGEAYRRLRTNLELADLSTLLIAGADPEDGASATAANLALAFAAQGQRVLLIDANFRQPHLNKAFPAQAVAGQKPAAFGLSNILLGQCKPAQAVRASGVENLDLIETGLLPPNPSELLTGLALQEALTGWQRTYDRVILDAPPVLVASDAKILSRFVAGTLLVFGADQTRRGAARRALEEVERVRGQVVGCVLFAVRALKGGYFREQYRSYRHYMRD